VNVFVEFPTGTDIEYTNKKIRKIEQDVITAMEPYGIGTGLNVESVLTNVGEGTSDPNSGQSGENQGKTPNKAKLTISFVQYENRTDVAHMENETERFNTTKAMNEIREVVGQIPGAVVSVSKDPNGPPVGPPINIAISGEEFDELFKIHDEVRTLINNAMIKGDISGIEKLKSDLDKGKPELLFDIDRAATRTYGLSTAQVAGALRTALFGNIYLQRKR
jgi:multidrug efflux pump subunit AcrB